MPTATPGAVSKTTLPGESMKSAEDITSEEVGTISAFQDDVAVEPWHHRAETARRLAYFLIALLAFSFLCHFIAVAVVIFYGKLEAVAALKDVFTLWLPVIAAMASSAVTYYFTKQR